MPQALLITQCLQNDFVQLIEKYDPVPNPLHVGYSEALRLLGERVEQGPVNRIMQWAYDQTDLHLLHIRDWHDPEDTEQAPHLAQFGAHCIRNTTGAAFVFEHLRHPGASETVLNASGLNDFMDTGLPDLLDQWKEQPLKVGIMGVWTEAKVYFLAYELSTRYPRWEIAVCSALTASSSRNMHFVTLRQLSSILGVTVYSSVGDFTLFLNGRLPQTALAHSRVADNTIVIEENYPVSETDRKLLRYLFRESAEAVFKGLDGGFSGNVVLKAASRDQQGHREVPSVVKIGPRSLIAQERTAFEQIEEVMGNNAPSIVDFAELEERGAIKYRYASMLEGKVSTFQDLYESGAGLEKLGHILHRVFKLQLGRLYDAAHFERLDLLEYYDFRPRYAPHVRQRVEEILGGPSPDSEIELLPGVRVYNPACFYEKDLEILKEENTALHFRATIHGDLNGKNIIIDAQENIWIIDFFHTHYGHILRDLIKLENDLLYIFTKLQDQADLEAAFRLTDALLSIENIGSFPDSYPEGLTHPVLRRTWDAVRLLRSFYNDLIGLDKAPYQLQVAQLRYAVHSLSFDECSPLQKKWALYASGKLCSLIRTTLTEEQKLFINYLYQDQPQPQIGLTILPGRRDWSRDLQQDLDVITGQEIKAVLTLVTLDELRDFGVPDLLEQYRARGLDSLHLPVMDQSVPTPDQLRTALHWMDSHLQQGHKILIHCVGGIGRSGTIAAAWLKKNRGLSPAQAINTVRRYRSVRCLENPTQEKYIEEI